MNFLQGKTYEEMKSDVMCYHAVVYNIMIIGEAATCSQKTLERNTQRFLGVT